MNDDVTFLLDKARDNLRAAKLLEQKEFYDIAASRVYYAMFYLAEALLHNRGLTYSSHSAVIAAFGKEFARTGELDPKYHQYLIKSQELRQTGDYGYRVEVTAESVKRVLDWAEEFSIAADTYLTEMD